MAIYEYFCSTCRVKFDRRRPMSEAATSTKCEKGHKAERTITAFAAVVGGEPGGFGDFEGMGGGGCGCGGACACAG